MYDEVMFLPSQILFDVSDPAGEFNSMRTTPDSI